MAGGGIITAKLNLKNLDETLEGIDNRSLYLIGALGIGSLMGYFAYLNLQQYVKVRDAEGNLVKKEDVVGKPDVPAPAGTKFGDSLGNGFTVGRKGQIVYNPEGKTGEEAWW